MSDGNRSEDPFTFGITSAFILAIAVCCFLAGWDLSADHTKDQIKADASIQYLSAESASEIKRRCPLTDPVALSKCADEIVKATNEAQNAEKDYVAQSDMARYAKWLLFIIAISSLVTAIGIWYVRLNLTEMKESRGITEKALEAAKDANRIAKQIGVAETRAYVIPSGPEIVDFEVGKCPVVVWKIKNFGQTPAFKFQIARSAGFAFVPNPKVKFRELNYDRQSITLAPGIEWPMSAQFNTAVTEAEYRMCMAGHLHMIAFAKFRYVDHTRRQRRGVFKIKMFREGEEWVMYNCPTGNRAN